MTPGTLVLLAGPAGPGWSGVADLLREYGRDVLEVGPGSAGPQRYVASAALAIRGAEPEPPLLLVARGAAGPLLPLLAAAQRAAHRAVGGYVVVDADLTVDRAAGRKPGEQAAPVDWPDAPCGYLRVRPEYDGQARIAGLRGWPVGRAESDDDRAVADAIQELIVRL
jgi:hypothetical protein